MDLRSAVFLLSLVAAVAAYFEGRATGADLRKLAAASNDFAVKVFRRLSRESPGNVFISPLSLSSAFGMLYLGTRGDTAKQLRGVLGYDAAGLTDDEVHSSFHSLLNRELRSSPNGHVIKSANALLADERLDLHPEYKRQAQYLYKALVQEVDFRNNGPQIVDRINSWVEEETQGKIDQLVTELDPRQVLVLLNAVYFKGTWETPFNPEETVDEVFYNHGSEEEEDVREVPMMSMKRHLPYATSGDCQILELPYRGGNASMLVFLPDKQDGLAELREALDADTVAGVRREMRRKKVDVALPKFRVEFGKELSRDLEALGADAIFARGADFGGMTDRTDVQVTKVVHKAMVEVNEAGSEAAAVSGVFGASRSMFRGPEFHANHPFLYAIVDTTTDMILFMGDVKSL